MANVTQLKHLEHLEDEMLNYGNDYCGTNSIFKSSKHNHDCSIFFGSGLNKYFNEKYEEFKIII